MPKWTNEQLDAIQKEGNNILVSAGAGSGKTAVLSERVLRKVSEGISIKNILVLTFTNAAAFEMKERIRKKLKEAGLKKQLEQIDSAYITTFDSFALSVVKKYHYLIDVPKDISITDENVINLKVKELTNQIFLEHYTKSDQKFLEFIDTYCLKDDTEIKKALIQMNKKLDLLYDKKDYLISYIEKTYNDKNIEELKCSFLEILFNKIQEIKENVDELTFLDCNDYYQDISKVLSVLLSAKEYSVIKTGINISLPRLPKNASDEIKKVKDNIKVLLEELISLCHFVDEKEITDSFILTKKHVGIIIDLLLQLDLEISNYKKQEKI